MDAQARVVPGPSASLWAVLGLGVTQNIGYGTLYYAFAILAPQISRELTVSEPWLFGAFSVATLGFGLVGPVAGRMADRRGGARALAAGSLVSALALAGMAVAPERWSFALALVISQLAAAFTLYEIAFVTLVQLDPIDARRRITHLTLIAGFASTMFWPLTSWLAGILDWRGVLWVYAALNLAVSLPIHLALASLGQRSSSRRAGNAPVASVEPRLPEADRPRGLALTMIGFALSGVVLSGLSVHFVPLLAGAGLSTAASAVAVLFGPAQVASRLINLGFGSSLPATRLAVVAIALVVAGLLVFGVAGASFAAAVAFTVLLGLGSGVTSVVRGTVPLALFGSAGYGALVGRITRVRMVATSLAPVLVAIAIERWGVGGAIWLMLALALAGLLAFVVLERLAR